jgi:putative endonuclease
MPAHIELGEKGEQLAVNYLRALHYNILETNWRWQKAEVDIIAQIDQTLVFVEVKTRSYDTVSKPEDAVHLKKQQLLKNAAEAYCEQQALHLELRFDIIAIIKAQGKTSTKHIQSAF